MRAKFVFEKFEEKSDPIEDMGIGRPFEFDVEFKDDFVDEGHKEKRNTKSWD